MITGTCYFVSRWAANEYYRLQGLSCSDVEHKLIDGEIHIGEPPYNPKTQYLAQIDRSLRYAVVDRQFRTEPTDQGLPALCGNTCPF